MVLLLAALASSALSDYSVRYHVPGFQGARQPGMAIAQLRGRSYLLYGYDNITVYELSARNFKVVQVRVCERECVLCACCVRAHCVLCVCAVCVQCSAWGTAASHPAACVLLVLLHVHVHVHVHVHTWHGDAC